jgi:hypothetical protein
VHLAADDFSRSTQIESVDDAVGDVEALDAEETFQAVFDDSGETYAIHWIRPNRPDFMGADTRSGRHWR